MNFSRKWIEREHIVLRNTPDLASNFHTYVRMGVFRGQEAKNMTLEIRKGQGKRNEANFTTTTPDFKIFFKSYRKQEGHHTLIRMFNLSENIII